MRQIPSEGTSCKGCPMNSKFYCSYYQEGKRTEDLERLPECLKDKPQVLTEKEREALDYQKNEEGEQS